MNNSYTAKDINDWFDGHRASFGKSEFMDFMRAAALKGLEPEHGEAFRAVCPLCDATAMELMLEKNGTLLGWHCHNCKGDVGCQVTTRVNVTIAAYREPSSPATGGK